MSQWDSRHVARVLSARGVRARAVLSARSHWLPTKSLANEHDPDASQLTMTSTEGASIASKKAQVCRFLISQLRAGKGPCAQRFHVDLILEQDSLMGLS